MSIKETRKSFIDRTARKPEGKWAVKSYNNPVMHYKSFKAVLEHLRLGTEDSYLEIGCGGGVLLSMALEKAGKGSAIDHSREMVDLALKNNEASVKQKRAEIIYGDACNLPWQDNHFTACASANMFFFIEEPDKMLREAFRVLKPGGCFVMSTMGKSILGKISFGLIYGLRTYTDKEMKIMMKRAGFSEVTVKTRFVAMQICYGVKK